MNVSTTSALAVAAGAGLAGVAPEQQPAALVLLVLLVGILQLLAGVFRLGFLVRFISNAVMTGFLNGVAVLIVLGQLGQLTGYGSKQANRVFEFVDLLLHVSRISLPTFSIGMGTLVLILGLLWSPWRRYALLLAVAAAAVSLWLLGWENVPCVGDVARIPRALPGLVMPQLALLPGLLVPALSLSIIGLIQGAGVSQAYPNPDGRYPDVSRDFMGQGIANLGAGLVCGIPAGGSISGTALMVSSGARSRWANISAGAGVALIVLLAAPLAERVPMPALAALLVVVGVQGLRARQAVAVWRTSRISASAMVLTFVAVLLMPLQYAILAGVAFSILLYTIRAANKVSVVEIIPEAGKLPRMAPAPRVLEGERVTLLTIYGSLFFAAARNIEDLLPVADRARRAVVIIALRGHEEVGNTFIQVLQRYAEGLSAQGGKLLLVGVDPGVANQLRRTGALAIIGEANTYPATQRFGQAAQQAVADAEAWLKQSRAESREAML
jgi:SulP family sulfate permease